MKIAIGSRIVKGPWGGGNLFTISLKKYLQEKHIKVSHNLVEKDIDIILLTEPRIDSSTSTITLLEAKLYKRFVNKNVKIVHRINECDERKGTKYVNKKMADISLSSDYTVFVSYWLESLYKDFGLSNVNSKVIMSGSDLTIFNDLNKITWDKSSKLKITTHHWGNNWNKGFELYTLLDNLLGKKELKEKFSFTYIGNLPKDYNFKNSVLKHPLSGSELAEELKNFDLYITGSLNEPSGNHQIEASLCGLPVLYLDSGGIPDYQSGFGTEITYTNLEEKLKEIYENYDHYFEKNKKFPFNSESMCAEYFKLFQNLHEKQSSKKFRIYFYIYKLLFNLRIIMFYKNVVSQISYQINKLRNI